MIRYVWDPLRRADIDRGNRLGSNSQPAAAPAADAIISRVPGSQTQSVDFDNLNYIKEMVRKLCN
jgi:hypothetical protein